MTNRLTMFLALVAGFVLAAGSVMAQPMPRIGTHLNSIAIPVPAARPRPLAVPEPAPRRTALYCMTIALYHEARGEPLTGQLAVARVILNRVKSKVYPDTVCGVVFENADRRDRCQFSFACDGRSDMPGNILVYARLLLLSQRILEDRITDRFAPVDPREYRTGDYDQVTHYHTISVAPSWDRRIRRVGQIGNHVFFRSARVARSL